MEKHGERDLYLDVGEQIFPFHFDLPAGIPTSFETSSGRIRYWIQGIIEVSSSSKRYTHRTFTVINKYDLNAIPSLAIPIGVADRKQFCCGFCRSKPVDISFDVRKSIISLKI